MAKRKTARPSRRRRPGAARAKSGRARTSTKRAKAGTARKTVRGRTSAARRTTPRSAAAKKTSARSASSRSAPARATTRATAKAPVKTAKRGARTLGRARSRRPRSSATPGGPASVPRRDKRRRGLPARLRQIERDRLLLEEEVPTPPSSLNLDRRPSAARSGRAEMEEALQEHTSTGPALTAGDLDADWESAYSTGDEAPGGDMPTPDQAVVEEIGTAMGVEYADNEELKGVDKIEQRDRRRWELDPASAEDYQDRARDPKGLKAKG